jgi:TRAP transporter TAXI family solute receptor
MKTKVERNLRVLKAAAIVGVVILLLYILLLVFAPHQLERLGAFLRNKLGPSGKRAIVVATAGENGHYYRLGNLLKEEMKIQCGQNVEAIITGGSLNNIQLLRNSEADFAFIQGALQEGKMVDFTGLNAIATTGWQYIHIIVPRNSPVKEFKDLKEKTVSLGPEKSGNAALGLLVFDFFRPSSYVKTVYTSVSRIKEDFREKRMDAIFTVYDLHAPVIETLLSSGDFRLIPIPEAPAIAYTIPGCFQAVLPHSLYGPYRDIPYKGAGPFPTLKVKTLLITRSEMNRYVIRDLLRTLYSTRFIKLSRLPELNEANGRHVFDLPLHPAADHYYRRNDPVTSDKYEIGSALLAGLLFIISIFSYLNTRRKIRRLEQKKQNIIPYFEELLKYSQRMALVEDAEQLKDLLDHMMAMQRRAEKQWLEGELDTEHMENLYTIYGIRCENAFHKMTLLQLIKQRELLEKTIETFRQSTGQKERKEKGKREEKKEI